MALEEKGHLRLLKFAFKQALDLSAMAMVLSSKAQHVVVILTQPSY